MDKMLRERKEVCDHPIVTTLYLPCLWEELPSWPSLFSELAPSSPASWTVLSLFSGSLRGIQSGCLTVSCVKGLVPGKQQLVWESFPKLLTLWTEQNVTGCVCQQRFPLQDRE